MHQIKPTFELDPWKRIQKAIPDFQTSPQPRFQRPKTREEIEDEIAWQKVNSVSFNKLKKRDTI